MPSSVDPTSYPRAPLWLRVSLLAILLAAFALRVPGLDGPRFHPDEALFASFARAIAVWRDPLLVSAPVDKPPLLFYLQALCYPFLGPREMAARLPNLFASTITVALTFALGQEVLGRSRRFSALLTAALAGFSPLAVAFGATAFTDPLMVAWVMAGLLAAIRGRPGYAGLWIGLGMATKYQAALFLPLAVGLLWYRHRPGGKSSLLPSSAPSTPWIRFLLGIGIPLALVLLWDSMRIGPRPFIAAQIQGYGELRLAPIETWPSRLSAWLELGGYWTGSLVLNAIVALTGLVLFLRMLARGRDAAPSVLALLCLSWLSSYLMGHLIINVPIWDRYLLPVVPLAALAAGWGIDSALVRARAFVHVTVVVLVLVLILVPAGRASVGLLPIGGDHGLYDGVDQIAEFFAAYPYGTVLYDHWLSWQLRYYLFDSRVYVSWFAGPAFLQQDLRVFGDRSPRFLIVPAWQASAPLRRAVAEAGFQLTPAFSAHRSDGSDSFLVYQITAGQPG